jgi:hypothetical protein
MSILLDRHMKLRLRFACQEMDNKLSQMFNFETAGNTFFEILKVARKVFENFEASIDSDFSRKIGSYDKYLLALKEIIEKDKKRIHVYPLVYWANGEHKKEVLDILRANNIENPETVASDMDSLLDMDITLGGHM